MIRHLRPAFVLITLTVLAFVALVFALASGSVYISPHLVWRSLWSDADTATAIVRELRLPRALGAFATGGLLALAGALMQVLLRNPLADPYVLGISGGAAVGALIGLLLGTGTAFMQPLAFAGALASTLIVFGLAHGEGRWTQTRLLLTGVIVASGWGALITLLLTLAPDMQLRGMLFWLIGDLSATSSYVPGLLALVLALTAIAPFARDLNQLARGELSAAALGVNVRSLHWGIYLLASFSTATAVTSAGAIGFVGFVVPHALRLLTGNDHRLLLPAAALSGGAYLVFADTLARTVVAPVQLPVGVITALVGVPVFLLLLARGNR